MKRESGERPPPVTGDEPAEQLDVVVFRAEEALVERLLGRPGGGSDSSARAPRAMFVSLLTPRDGSC